VRAPEGRALSPQARLRRRHEREIFRAISGQVAVSRSQLAEQVGLSGQSVGRIVRALLDAGLVEETEIERPDGPGASPVGLHVRSEGAFALGFGLERDRLNGVMLDLGGTVRWQRTRKLAKTETAKQVLQNLEDDVGRLLANPGWSERRERLCGVGLAAPGPIDLVAGAIVGPPNFPTWEHVDVADELGRALNVPVLVDNSATAAAVGVAWRLPHDHAPYLYCYWGLGIGGGLVSSDNVYRGTTGNAVEIGHVVADSSGRPCACGGRGCLEAEASAAALLRDAAAYGHFRTLTDLVKASHDRPELAALLASAADKVASALVSVTNIVDVDRVLLGGEHFGEVEEVFLPVIRERVEGQAFRRRVAKTTVEVSEDGEVANAIGAAALVFHSLLPAQVLERAVQERPRDLGPARPRGLWDPLWSRS